MYQEINHSATESNATFNKSVVCTAFNDSVVVQKTMLQQVSTQTACDDGIDVSTSPHTAQMPSSLEVPLSADKVLSSPRSCLSESVPSYSDNDMYRLGPDYSINQHDVMCGRGKGTLSNNGNKAFRKLIATFLNRFLACKKRVNKQSLIAEILDIVRSTGGHFLKQDSKKKDVSTATIAGGGAVCGEWYDIGNKAAAAKIGHCFRDLKPADQRRAVEEKKTKSVVDLKSKSSSSIRSSKKLSKKTSKKPSRDHQFGDIGGMFNPVNDELLETLDIMSFQYIGFLSQ